MTTNDETALETSWQVLLPGVVDILTGQTTTNDVAQIFKLETTVKQYCLRVGPAGGLDQGKELYRRLLLLLHGHTVRVGRLVVRCAGARKDSLLPAYAQQWRAYQQAMFVLRKKVFQYFSPARVRAFGCAPVQRASLQLWRQNVLEPVQRPLFLAVAQRCNELRGGFAPLNDAADVRELVASLFVLDGRKTPPPAETEAKTKKKPRKPRADELYTELERILAEEVYVFCSTDPAAIYLSSQPLGVAVLEQIGARARVEKDLCAAFALLPATRDKLLTIVGSLLLGASKLPALRACFQQLLDQGRYDVLATVVEFLDRLCPADASPVRADFQDFMRDILSRAMLLIAKGAAKNPRLFLVYVETLIDFRTRFKHIIDTWLHFDDFPALLESAFRQVLNQNSVTRLGIQPARLLSRYVDYLLRQPISSNSNLNSTNTNTDNTNTDNTNTDNTNTDTNSDSDDDDNTEMSAHERLRIVLDCFFPLLEAKEYFIGHYATDCAKRILYRLSSSEAWEREALALLRRHADERALETVVRMFGDVNDSAEFQTEFAAYLAKQSRSNPARELDFNLLVVSPARWPIPLAPFQFASAAVSPHIAAFEAAVSSCFLRKHPGKKLLMLHHFARGHLRAHFAPSGAYTFLCSGTQVAVLLLFNTAPACTYEQLHATTALPENELALATSSLLKAQLLVADPPLPDDGAQQPIAFRPSQSFRLNAHFSCPKQRIRISELIPLRSSVDRHGEQNCVSAAIVRIIKPLETISYSRLVSQLLAALKNRFEPDTQLIGSALTALVDRGLLAFDPETNQYSYLHGDE